VVADPVRARVSLGVVDILSTIFPDTRNLRVASDIGGVLPLMRLLSLLRDDSGVGVECNWLNADSEDSEGVAMLVG
jgi:hypothetical protein